LDENIDALAERLVRESLFSMFRKLHPEKTGWNLSLLNVAVTNMPLGQCVDILIQVENKGW
jgi:DNA polymerase iota